MPARAWKGCPPVAARRVPPTLSFYFCCVSGWAFAAAGNMEAVNYLQGSGSLVELSKQQLLDCSYQNGNYGCHGGSPHNAYSYVTENGITVEGKYPYMAKELTCKKRGGEVKIGKMADVLSGDCNMVLQVLMKEPIAVLVDASLWQFYAGGIFNSCDNLKKSLNHAALLVGYQIDTYYKIKNSWGEDWGERGYIRIVKSFNDCGVCDHASFSYIDL